MVTYTLYIYMFTKHIYRDTKTNLWVYAMLCVYFYNFWKNLTQISFFYKIVSYVNSFDNILLIFFFIIFLKKNKKKYTVDTSCIYVAIFLIFLCIWCDVFGNYLFIINYDYQTNTNLVNGIMLIHPMFLYSFYTLFILFLYSEFFKLNWSFFSPTKKMLEMFTAIIVAILLGCFWAEQELSWGGWWNWDFVEVLSIIIFISLSLIIHMKKINIYTAQQPIQFVVVCICILFLTTFAVRFNLVNSIHNFISFGLENQQNTYLLFVVVVLIFILCQSTINIFLQKNKNISILCWYFFLLQIFLIKYYILNIGLYDNLLNRNFTLNVFTCATIIYILLIFFKKNYLIHGVFPLLLIFNISTINTYVAFFIFMLYLSLTNIKTKLIHIHTLIFFIFINLQVYVFDNNFVEFLQNFYIKVNNTNSVVCSCLLTDRFGVWCKNAVFFVTDSTAYADEIILKVISEKSLFGFIKNSTFYSFEDILVTQHFIFVFFSSVIFIISLSLNVNLTTTTMKFF